jgi:hypothetical protein
MRTIPAVSFFLALSGCMAPPLNPNWVEEDSMPSLSVTRDGFDGSTIVRQDVVSSSSKLVEGWHALGFEWRQKTPETVFITAGISGTAIITDLAFNADGEIINRVKPSTASTDYGWVSTRQFAISWQDFLKLTSAQSVKMKVVRLSDYTVSSFGPAHSGTMVNSRIAPFVEKVRELRADLSR